MEPTAAQLVEEQLEQEASLEPGIAGADLIVIAMFLDTLARVEICKEYERLFTHGFYS